MRHLRALFAPPNESKPVSQHGPLLLSPSPSPCSVQPNHPPTSRIVPRMLVTHSFFCAFGHIFSLLVASLMTMFGWGTSNSETRFCLLNIMYCSPKSTGKGRERRGGRGLDRGQGGVMCVCVCVCVRGAVPVKAARIPQSNLSGTAMF